MHYGQRDRLLERKSSPIVLHSCARKPQHSQQMQGGLTFFVQKCVRQSNTHSFLIATCVGTCKSCVVVYKPFWATILTLLIGPICSPPSSLKVASRSEKVQTWLTFDMRFNMHRLRSTSQKITCILLTSSHSLYVCNFALLEHLFFSWLAKVCEAALSNCCRM